MTSDKVKFGTRLKSGRWIFNVNVPSKLLTVFGRANYQKALGTTDRREAEKWALAMKAKFDKACDLLNEGKPLRYALIASELTEGTPLEIAQARIDSLPPQARAALMRGVAPTRDGSDVTALALHLKRLLVEHSESVYPTLREAQALAETDPTESHILKFRLTRKVLDLTLESIDNLRFALTGKRRDRDGKLKTLDDMLVIWKEEEKPKLDRLGVYEGVLRRFKEIVGDLPVSEITSKHVADFKAQIARLPSIVARPDMRKKTMKELIKVAEEGGLERISGANVSKHLTVIRTLLEVAKKNACVTQNVAADIKVSRPKRRNDDEEGRRGFTADELNRYFRAIAAKYTPENDPYWLPVIGAYSGLRREEIGQINLEDICCDNGIWYFNINRRNGNQLKNDNSKRTVPIHHVIIKAGFLDHVERSKQMGPGKVFKSLKLTEGRNKYTSALGQMMSNILRNDAGVTDPDVKPCHGLRHTFASACRDVDTSATTLEALLGQASDNPVTGKYGRRAVIETLNKALQQVEHIGVDISNLTRKTT